MDKYNVQLLSRALRDLDEIYGYIANHLSEPGTAEKLIDELESSILSLEHLPHRCAERQTGVFANKGYRQMFVKSYTVIYRIDENEKKVTVVTVRYSKSNF